MEVRGVCGEMRGRKSVFVKKKLGKKRVWLLLFYVAAAAAVLLQQKGKRERGSFGEFR